LAAANAGVKSKAETTVPVLAQASWVTEQSPAASQVTAVALLLDTTPLAPAVASPSPLKTAGAMVVAIGAPGSMLVGAPAPMTGADIHITYVRYPYHVNGRKVLRDKTNTPRIMPAPAVSSAIRKIKGKTRSRTHTPSVGAEAQRRRDAEGAPAPVTYVMNHVHNQDELKKYEKRMKNMTHVERAEAKADGVFYSEGNLMCCCLNVNPMKKKAYHRYRDCKNARCSHSKTDGSGKRFRKDCEQCSPDKFCAVCSSRKDRCQCPNGHKDSGEEASKEGEENGKSSDEGSSSSSSSSSSLHKELRPAPGEQRTYGSRERSGDLQQPAPPSFLQQPLPPRKLPPPPPPSFKPLHCSSSSSSSSASEKRKTESTGEGDPGKRARADDGGVDDRGDLPVRSSSSRELMAVQGLGGSSTSVAQSEAANSGASKVPSKDPPAPVAPVQLQDRLLRELEQPRTPSASPQPSSSPSPGLASRQPTPAPASRQPLTPSASPQPSPPRDVQPEDLAQQVIDLSLSDDEEAGQVIDLSLSDDEEAGQVIDLSLSDDEEAGQVTAASCRGLALRSSSSASHS
jgi:hypothetical protein